MFIDEESDKRGRYTMPSVYNDWNGPIIYLQI